VSNIFQIELFFCLVGVQTKKQRPICRCLHIFVVLFKMGRKDAVKIYSPSVLGLGLSEKKSILRPKLLKLCCISTQEEDYETY
jgi:hypothetical protein